MGVPSLDPGLIDEIVGRIGRELRNALSDLPLATTARETPPAIASAAVVLRSSGNQPEALRALLDAATRLGARAALFVVRGDQLEGWEGNGFEDDPALAGILRGIRLPGDHSAIRELLEERRAVYAEVGGAFTVPDFGQTVRGEALLVPLLVQDKVAGIVYADPASGEIPFDRGGVEALVAIAGLAIERVVLMKAVAQTSAARPAAATPPPPPAGPVAVPPAAHGAPPVPPQLPAARTVDRVTPAAAPRPSVNWPGAGAQEPGAEIEDARRYARLLMEEIALYHGDKVDQGRAQHDLLSRLGDEIHQARAMYDRRVEAHVRETGDYFEEALVRVLGGGDAHTLGAAQGQPS